MINHIRLHNIATYSEPVDINLKKINFIFGGNGTGKTTLSKLISGDLVSHDSCVDRDDDDEKILVYNKVFVERSFREVDDISGIFTLGSDATIAHEYIQKKQAEYDRLYDQIRSKDATIKKLIETREGSWSIFKDSCWSKQTELGIAFPQALAGYRGSKEKFANKCLELYAELSDDLANVMDITSLISMYHSAYSKDARTYDLYSTIDLDEVAEYESNELLNKKITGKSDSDIGRFIEYLGSSDWVKRGMHYFKNASGKCPYCSQTVPLNIQEDIEAFFDTKYQAECEELKLYSKRYALFHQSLISLLNAIVSSKYEILVYDELCAKIELYQSIVDKNLGLLTQKNESPSLQVELESCLVLLGDITKIIVDYNSRIQENNEVVEHQNKARDICVKEIWKLICFDIKDIISDYLKNLNGNKRAVEALSSQINTLTEQKNSIEREIREKRATISNVEHTVDAINNILQGYGFNGFKLSSNGDVTGTYKIIRPDGSDAKASLSEGEYNFITFLYFYHLVFGSQDINELNKNKIIVIDDPISSLDSNVLFIVSSLVKNIISYCRNAEHSIKQVIVSTHNIYFHKEITFCGSRDHWPESKTAFYIVRKKNNVSNITEYSTNPIKSSYELLWDDVRDSNTGTAKSVFNTMRRILENYFNIIGGIDYEKCINDFTGEDKIICKSLVSCINEQSHTISDDYYMCIEDSELDQYLLVFKRVFENMGHLSHYNMMMGIDNE